MFLCMEGVMTLPEEACFMFLNFTSSISPGLCALGLFLAKAIVQYVDECAFIF